jgi:pimeloyl-ACP methyl ester carboxylesterase
MAGEERERAMTEVGVVERGTRTAPIVMVHGDFGDGFDTWGEVARQLGTSRRTIIMDRPGFGVSVQPDERFTIAGDAAYLRQIVSDMAIESLHLVGHSYGALVALETAIAVPESVRSLHLIEPPLLGLLAADDETRRMDHAIRAIQARHREVGDAATTAAFFPMIGADRVVERLRGTPEWTRLCGYATRFAHSEPAGSYPADVLDRLPGEIPVALYSGGRSHAVLRGVVAEIVKRLPGCRLIDVPAAGHAVQMSGAAFMEPMLALMEEADRAWDARASAAADATRE